MEHSSAIASPLTRAAAYAGAVDATGNIDEPTIGEILGPTAT